MCLDPRNQEQVTDAGPSFVSLDKMALEKAQEFQGRRVPLSSSPLGGAHVQSWGGTHPRGGDGVASSPARVDSTLLSPDAICSFIPLNRLFKVLGPGDV